jgi:hypothetical protein
MAMPSVLLFKKKSVTPSYIVDWMLEIKFNYSQWWSYSYNIETNTIWSFFMWNYLIHITYSFNWFSTPEMIYVYVYNRTTLALITSWALGLWTHLEWVKADVTIQIKYAELWFIKVMRNTTNVLLYNINTLWQNTWTFWIEYFSWAEFLAWDRSHSIFNAYINTYDSLLVLKDVVYSTTFPWVLDTSQWDVIRPEYQADLNPWRFLRGREYWDSWSKSFIISKNLYNFW